MLDEKEVNIEVLRENAHLSGLKRTLESVKREWKSWKKIDHFHSDVQECMRKDSMYEFYLSQADADISGEQIQRLEKEIKAEERRKEDTQKSCFW